MIRRFESTVSRTIKKLWHLAQENILEDYGRCKKFNEGDISILKKRKDNPKTSLRKSSMEIAKQIGTAMCHHTIRKWHNSNNIFGYAPIKSLFYQKR